MVGSEEPGDFDSCEAIVIIRTRSGPGQPKIPGDFGPPRLAPRRPSSPRRHRRAWSCSCRVKTEGRRQPRAGVEAARSSPPTNEGPGASFANVQRLEHAINLRRPRPVQGPQGGGGFPKPLSRDLLEKIGEASSKNDPLATLFLQDVSPLATVFAPREVQANDGKPPFRRITGRVAPKT